MRVAKLVQPNNIEIFEEDLDKSLDAGDVLIQVKAVAICGTDLHIFKGERSDVKLPRVMGHELSGLVVSVGEDVKKLKVGDKVVVDPVISCGVCHVCKKGHHNVCSSVGCLGVHEDGGFKDFIKIPERRVHKISDSIPWDEAALLEPFSVAAQIVERGRVQAGDRVTIIGAGAIGLAVLQACKVLGAKVLISDMVDSRLELAKGFGADIVVNSRKEDIKEKVNSFTDNFGADVVIDAVGYAKLLELSIELASPAAKVVVIGFDGNSAAIQPVVITKKELEIIGSRMNNNKFPAAVKWFENKEVNPKPMISAIYNFEDINKAFNDIVNNPDGIIRGVIIF